MHKIKSKKGFTLLELAVSISAISIIMIFIYQSINGVLNIQKDQKILKEASELKKTITLRVQDNNVLLHTLDNPDGFTSLDSTETIYPKNEFVNLLQDTDDNIQNLKQEFWGIESNGKTKYIYIIQRYHTTYYGKIPYNDIYIAVLSPLFDKIFKTHPEKLLTNIFEEVTVTNGAVTETVGINSKFFAEYNATNYPDLLSATFKLKKSEFQTAVRQSLFFKVSTRDVVLERFNRSVDKMNKYAKNLQDWASIQMSMYENILVSYGGSYNIGYFNSLSNVDDGEDAGDGKTFSQKMSFSSALIPSEGSVGIRDANNGFLIPIAEPTSTKYGIVACLDCENGNSIASVADSTVQPATITKNTATIDVNGAIQLDSPYLMEGSKSIFGIGAGDVIINEFGFPIYFSNISKTTIELDGQNLPSGTDSSTIIMKQNVPTIGSYAPYSATLFTIFPWILQYDDSAGTRVSDIQGYVAVKIFPELR